MTITPEQLTKLAEAIADTADELSGVLERLGIEAETEEAEDRLLDANLERCAGCDYWYECGAMEMSDEHNGPVCQECCPALFE